MPSLLALVEPRWHEVPCIRLLSGTVAEAIGASGADAFNFLWSRMRARHRGSGAGGGAVIKFARIAGSGAAVGDSVAIVRGETSCPGSD